MEVQLPDLGSIRSFLQCCSTAFKIETEHKTINMALNECFYTPYRTGRYTFYAGLKQNSLNLNENLIDVSLT